MIQITAIHMVGADHLQHISLLRWVEVDNVGGPAKGQPQDATRAQMVEFVGQNPRQSFAIGTTDNTYAFLEVVAGIPSYVKTLPDSSTSDNLLSLPRF